MGDFISRMELAYAAADLVISRSGAMAIAELCVVHKPVIFVPFPFAAEDHQTVNAKNLVEKNAALMIRDQDVNSQLIPTVKQLAENEQQQQELAENIGKHAVLHADEDIAKTIIDSLGKS